MLISETIDDIDRDLVNLDRLFFFSVAMLGLADLEWLDWYESC